MDIKGFVMGAVYSLSNATRKKDIDYFSDAREYHCKTEDITHIASSSNLMVFTHNGQKMFFKECRCHTDKNGYAKTVVSDFFDLVLRDNTLIELKKLILDDLREEAHLKRFFQLHTFVTHNYSTIKKYDGWDTSIVGLPSLSRRSEESATVKKFLDNIFPRFIEYARNETEAYAKNNYVGNNNYQTYKSSLSIATRKLAVLYGLENMVPDIWYAKLVIDGNIEKCGTVMKEAPGRCSLELSMEEKQHVTPEFQRQLNILNLFDVICFQRDHKQENYFVIYDDKENAEQVCAFDNDYPLAFSPFPIVNFDTCIKCSPYIVDGRINRPYVDKNLYDKIISVSYGGIEECLSDDLSGLQIHMLWQRIKKIRKAFQAGEEQQYILLTQNEWTEETIDTEIHGPYGKTYLKHYLECDEDALVAEIMNNQ